VKKEKQFTATDAKGATLEEQIILCHTDLFCIPGELPECRPLFVFCGLQCAYKQGPMLSIIQAETEEQLATVRELMLEYAAWLEFELCFQGFEEELRTLPGKYALPDGRLLLAMWSGETAGIGALRPLKEAGVCEMKRLYVRPRFRGHSIGLSLAQRLIRDAAEIGYERMRLDTVPGKMDSAIAMYRRLGFEPIEPYYGTPISQTLFMELTLTRGSGIIKNPQVT
jgi:putative acetyltransferase